MTRGQLIAAAAGFTDAAAALECMRETNSLALLEATSQSELDTAIVLGTATMPDLPHSSHLDRLALGACQNRYFVADFAANTQVWVYEFAHRYGPGLTAIPGYVWGAGHAAELPYLWPSFDNGKPIAPTFSAGERELASQLVAYWSAFVKRGDPAVPWQPRWSSFTDRTSLLSLDVGRSRQLPLEKFERRQQCGFWDALFA